MDLLLGSLADIWGFFHARLAPFFEPQQLFLLTYVLGVLAVAWGLAASVHWLIGRYFLTSLKKNTHAEKAYLLFKPVLLPLIAFVFLGTGQALLANHPAGVWFNLGVALNAAWLVLSLLGNLVHNPALGRMLAGVVWVVLAAHLLGLLSSAIQFLDMLALPLGAGKISLLDVFQGVITVGILIWVAGLVSEFLEYYLNKVIKIKAVASVLIMKVVRVALLTLAFLVTLTMLGIDLTALAVFGGALGVGLGFGLQKVVSNYISGIIILSDKSIQPGDVIELGDTYGHISYLGARYISVITPDGRKHLIPNEEFITTRVINWSYSNDLVCQRVPVSIAHASDLDKAIDLCIAAARTTDRVLADPAPNCLVHTLGPNSIDLLVLFWIHDPKNGILNIRSALLKKIWEDFKKAGIQVPHPQMDVHLKSMPAPTAKKPTPKRSKTA
jgi:small-conductance mechanosensitive channel